MRSTESTDSGEQDLRRIFAQITAALSDGDLVFQAPFDLATSAALAANMDIGNIAERLFEVTQMRETSFRVVIQATAPGVEDRDVVNTTVPGSGLLVALLEGLLDEICARQERQEGDPSGG